MPTIAEIQRQYPDLDGLDDNQVVDALHSAFYADMPREQVAASLGVKPKPEPPKPRSWGAVAKDVGISALKGAIGVPEAAVGIADLVSGGYAGKLAEQAGFRSKDAKAILNEGYSEQQKAAFQKVQAAEGIGDTFMAAVENPSVIAHSIGESIPMMGAGGVVARGGLALAPKIGPVVAGAMGEGVVGAGAAAEQIRQQTPTGLLTGPQAGLAGATGAVTGLFGAMSGKIAQRLGIADVDTMMAGAAVNPALRKGVVRSALEGAVSEGILEELPQSVSEQVLQNMALGKPLDEGVNQAAVMGLLAGSTMGAGANAVHSFSAPPVANPPPPPPAGPLVRAATLGLPSPVITVASDGTALTAEGRNAGIQSRGNALAEQGIMGIGRNSDITDVVPRDVPPAPPAPPAAPRAERRNTDAVELNLPTADPTADYIEAMRAVNTPAARFYVREFDAGRITAEDVADRMSRERGKTPDERIAAAAAEAPIEQIRPGDILNPKGQPFRNKPAANRAAKADGGVVLAVPGGFAVRKDDAAPKQDDAAAQAPQAPQAQAAIESVAPPADVEAQAQAVLASRRKNNASGQGGEDIESIRAGLMAPQAPPAPTVQAAAGLPQTAPSDKSPTLPDIRTITAKQIPDMTVDEIGQAITHYGPDHPRTAKLQAALAKRPPSPTLGEKSEPQADQAQPQPAKQEPQGQAPANQRQRIDALNARFKEIEKKHRRWFTGEGKARTLDANAPQDVKDEWSAYKAERQAIEAADGNAAPAPVEDTNEQWQRTPTAERDAIAVRAGITPLIAKTISKMEWKTITSITRGRLLAVMASAAPATNESDFTPNQDAIANPENYLFKGKLPAKSSLIVKRAIAHVGSEVEFKRIVDEHFRELAIDGYPIPADEAIATIEALADEVLGSDFDHADSPYWSHPEFEPLPALEGKDFPRNTNPFPKPKATVVVQSTAKENYITQDEANAKLAEWKAAALKIGREKDNSNKVIFSLYDRTGIFSQPFVDAGYTVYRYDLEMGTDLVEMFPIHDITNVQEAGMEVVGVIAQPPCTSFSSAGSWSWAEQHDKPSKEWTRKKYGDDAAENFESPLDAAVTMVRIAELAVELANPSGFHVLENPVGRIARMADLPEPTLTLHPHHYGNPWTKKTLLWGKFNTDLPTANVSPNPDDGGQGSMISSKLRGSTKEQKLERSISAEGMAYAFFMANDPDARAMLAAPPAAPARSKNAATPPDAQDLKTYSTAEAGAVWDKLSPARRSGALRRTDLSGNEELAGKAWADLDAASRKQIQAGLNEDFFAPNWYINKKGQQVSRDKAPTANAPSDESLALDAAAPRWDEGSQGRQAVLNSMALDEDTRIRAQYTDWKDLSPDFRAQVAQAYAKMPAAPVNGNFTTSAAEQRANAAESEKKRRAAGLRARQRAYDANPMRAFLGKHGVSIDVRGDFAPGRAEQRAAMVQGYGPIFRRSGLQLDLLANKAVEEGFLLTPDVPALESLITSALAGRRIIAQYAEGVAEDEMTRRQDENRQREQDDAEAEHLDELTSAPDAVLTSYADSLDDDNIPWDAPGVEVSDDDFLRATGATEQEIEHELGYKSGFAGQNDAPDADGQGAASGQAQGNAGQGNEAPGLTSPSQQEVVDAQDRADAATRADKAQRAADRERERLDNERRDIAKQSEAAAGTFTLGGDAEQNLSGQGGMFDEPPAAAPAPKTPSANTIFTEDAANAARARLLAKRGRLGSGIDPEMLLDGITLAGYHIEKGARTFAAYAKAMISDLGDEYKPYLKSWYMGVKFDPRAASFEGMDSAAYVESFKDSDIGKDITASAWWNAIDNRTRSNVLAKIGINNQAPDTVWGQLRRENQPKIETHYAGLNTNQPDAAPAPADPILRRWPAPDGMEVRLMTHNKGHSVGLFDKDAGETVGITLYSGSDSLEKATAAAEKLAKDSNPPTPTPGQTLTQSLAAAIEAGNMPKDNPALKKLVEAFDGKPADPARMKQAQEELETAIAMTARKVVAKNEGDRSTFNALLRLYESQPNLNIRTSTSIANQAYSTPAPLAFLASRLAGITRSTVAHEPTAGTGMLLIGADPKKAIVNELNDLRISALKAQGFTPTQLDAATQRLVPEGTQPGAVVTNPPFGSIKDSEGRAVKVKVDGYNIGQIDHLIAARALQSMKDDGRATLILGANKVAGGLSTDDRIFFNWLYSHYNVTGHFEVEGDLYTRQGAGWPVRVITINGRQASSKLSPVAGTINRVDNWEQVYEQFTQSLKDSTTQGSIGASPSTEGAGARPLTPAPAPSTAGGRRPQSGTPGTGNVAGTPTGVVPDRAGRTPEQLGAIRDEQRLNAQPNLPRPQPGQNPAGDGRPAKPAGAIALNEPAKGNEFQVPYTPRSARKDEGVLIPTNMAQPLQDALSRLEDEVGDIDEFARKELGYDTVGDLHDALMGLQVDSVAMSIWQMKQGKGVVISDQTGIGKGRQAASIIRWAVRNGQTPVFMSVKPSLFTDMYGDLADIGTNDVNPFIMNSGEWISGEDGSKLFANKQALHRRVIDTIADDGTLPEGRNAVFLTYSQINKANRQRTALTSLAPNAIFILDESHNAAGESATGQFMIDTLGLAKGVTYLSATYAKRPDNMPLYFKTDIGAAAADTDGLAVAMASGGLPLQTVVSNNLVKAGQMFRRERSYDGVSIESRFDTQNRAKHEEMSDKATSALRAIVSADRMFHESYVKALQKELAKEGGTVQDSAGNQVEKGVEHTEFSSVVHNFVKQMLLGLKAQTAADEAIASLKRGEKPIIAVENTMGSFLNEFAEANAIKAGDSLGSYDYRVVLSRALDRSRVITEVNAYGDKIKRPVALEELDALTRIMYDDAQEIIDALDLDIPASPIDWMRDQITKAGFSVAEITGRNLAVDYTDPQKPVLSSVDAREQNDKVHTTRQFNSGKLDALILNVAGSTGISLHASEKFADQRQRYMIVAQAAGDINVFMQMLGRIHRTGQVRLPKYAVLSVDLPTEKRPTAVLSVKMKSLNANTSSNTESATSVKSLDILNKYGDQVVFQHLAEDFQLTMDLGLFGGGMADDQGNAAADLARKATGRLALQPIAVQKAFYEEVEAQYSALIDYLNKTNQNDLEPRTFDFDAKETRQEILFDGPDPTTPFGEDAVYGEYSIKAQGTPMTPAEIKTAIDDNLGGKTGLQHAEDITSNLLQAYAKEMNASRKAIGLDSAGNFDEVKYYAAMKAFYGEDAAMGWVNRAKAQIKAGGKIKEFTADDMRSIQGSEAGMQFIKDHAIGRTFRVDINSEPFNAVVTNIRNTHKGSGNPFSLSKIQLTVSVNGALRSLSVPATQFKKIEVSSLSTFLQIEQLFKEQPPNQRETAKIVTGNLLAGYGELQGVRGTIISFTKEDGTTEQGILLPKLFDYTRNTRGDYRLPTAASALTFLQDSQNRDIGRFGIMSRDSIVRVLPAGRGIKIQVPKSKLKGGKFFLDKGLIDAGGDFVTAGNFMTQTSYEPADAVKVLELLIKKQALYALPSMADEAKRMNEGNETKFSRVTSPPTRRNFLIASAAASASSASKAGTTLGKAKPLLAADLEKALPPEIAKILRGNGATSLEGAKAIGAAMQEIATNGPPGLRALARQIAEQLPKDGVMLTVDDKRVMNAHGAVSWKMGMPHLQLFTAGGRTGMTYGTFLHESLHVVVLAKYKTLNNGMVRSNDKLLGAAAPAASKEMAQLSKLMDEFAIAAKANPAKDADTRLSVSEALNDPDEFFVRALTDDKFQTYLAGIEYEGKSMLERFKDWVKGFFTKSGIRPSWLDAALLASQELTTAMGKDAPNFARMKASGILNEKRQAAFSRVTPAQALASAINTPTETTIGKTSRAYTAQQLGAMKNVGFTVTTPSIKDRAEAIWQDLGKKMAQGIADQFAPIKELDEKAYNLLRLSKGSSGAFESLLRGGKLKLTDNVYDFDDAKRGGVIDTLLTPLQGEHHDALRWVAANRAERLMDESQATRAEGEKLLDDAVQLDKQARALDNQAKQYLQQAGNFPKLMTGNQLAQKANAVEANKLMAQAERVRKEATEKRKEGNEKKNVSRENLFTREDIDALKTLASGAVGFDYTLQHGFSKGTVTRSRALIYKDFNAVLNGFNANVLDMATQSGLIDPESRKLWENEFYVPFYRVADESDGGVRGMNIGSGVVRQQAFKTLKGGRQALKADLMDNVLMNWAHLLDAGAKNRAAKASLEAAEKMGVAVSAPETTVRGMAGTIGKKNNVVWFMDEGKPRHFLIDDPYVMTALTALEYAGMRNPAMNAMGAFKHALTLGVTASPFFKIRNLIRDSVQVIASGPIGYNPAANIKQGWALTDPKSDAYFRLLAGGGTIHFGTMMEGSESKRIQSLVESGVKDFTILDGDQKIKAFYRKFIEPGVTAYNELGNRGEAVNRAALYDQLVKQGVSHADASLQARDLMDFSMQGSFTAVRFLTQVVPFMNARIQGLYKLGRAVKDDPKRFGAVLGAVALFSLALLAAYGDDDDWKKRESWDRNNFWWFKFGGVAFRIPKPFEMGAIGTLAERGFELAFDKEMTNKRFLEQVLALLSDNLSMNPIPQLVKPLLDVYANKDSFSGRPIETMSQEKLKPEYRFNDRTSMTARGASTALNAVTGIINKDSLSPVQIDHMLRGYFGWLGSFVVGTADLVARPATGQTQQATPDYWKTATGGMVSDLSSAPSGYVSKMYDQAKQIEQDYGTWHAMVKEGKAEDARAFREDHLENLTKYKQIEHVKKQTSELNKQIKQIERSDRPADEKRERIDSLRARQDRIARLVA